MLAREGADEETIIAALLHDAVEDTPLTHRELEEQFGQKIAQLVEGVTKLTESEFAESLRDKRIETLRKMFLFMQEDIRIIVIKLFDRLHNMRTLFSFPPEKRQRIAEDTLEVFVKVAGQLCMKQLRDKLEFLSIQSLHPEWSHALQREQQRKLEETQTVIQHLQGLMQTRQTLHFDARFFPVPLRWSKLFHFLQEEQQQGVRPPFPLAVAIVVSTVEDCFRVLYLLHRLWQREILSFEDFINTPQLNGYQGLHTTIILQDGRRVRCKIRTAQMDEYSRRGITANCFTGSSARPVDWLASTLTLSQGLKRSEEFWNGLQSDILGESMLIHGPGDRTVLMPKGSTALDGAFYCLQDEALRMEQIRVNGREVPFASPLSYADAISMVLGKQLTVERQWLDWVKSGLATAKIRGALAKQSRERKLTTGHAMLQEVLNDRGKGLLEEFDEQSLAEGLSSLGFSTVDEVCIAIAEGLFEPREVYNAIFERKVKKRDSRECKHRYTIRLSLEGRETEARRRLLKVYQRYDADLVRITNYLQASTSSQRQWVIFARLTEEGSEELKRELVIAGGQSVQVVCEKSRWIYAAGVAVLLTLWGMDPVLAALLLQAGVSPFDLVSLRFFTAFLLSAVILLVRWLFSAGGQARLRSISVFNRALFLSGIALFFTALFTYLSLQFLSPITYITLIIAGTIVTFSPLQLSAKEARSWCFALSTVAFLLVGPLFLLREGLPLLSPGPLAGIGASLGFSLYSIASTRYQLQESIRTRYLSFSCYLSLFALSCSLVLFSFTHDVLPRLSLLLPAALFTLFFTALPYLLYYELLKRGGGPATGRFLPLVVLVTVLGQLLASREWQWALLLPVLVALCWVVAYEEREAERGSLVTL
jgi:RelA/SpoT family (p)ppGpp synthetase